MKNIAVVGFGARAEGMLRNLNVFEMDATVSAVADTDPSGAAARLKSAGFAPEGVRFYQSMDDMLSKERPDGLVVATRCDTHAAIAAGAMKYGLPLLLEKPVAIDDAQLRLLAEADQRYHGPTLISFPLRASYLMKLVKKIVQSGELGKLSHIEAVNNVTYGRVYYKSWYRDEAITGGLFLQKATHDLDYINYLMEGVAPVQLCAMESKRIFAGDEPAAKRCDQCEKYRVCPESPFVLKHDHHGEEPYGNGCSFAADTGNHDSASILVRYANGLHAVYTQDFVARKAAARRGACVIGYDATLEFDWITGECKVYSHRDRQVATYHIDDSALYHYGGDKALCENFVELMKGGASIAPMRDGLLSAHMCLQARKSARENTFLPIQMGRS